MTTTNPSLRTRRKRETATPRFATPPRPDTDPRVIVPPTIRRSQPSDGGRLSVWEAVIGAVVAGPSALAVVGLNSTLRGTKGTPDRDS
jgi:hypothetical protein